MENLRLNNISVPADIAALRDLDPTLPDWVWNTIIAFRPNLPSTQWEATREFVVSCVVSMKPRTFDSTRRLLTMTARFVAWVWTRAGDPLTIERVFVENYRRLYLTEKLGKHSEIYRWGVQRQLTAIAESATPKRRPLTRIDFSKAHSAPYTTQELAHLSSWANTLTTPLKRRNAWALLGACGGAGLSAAELIAAQVEDFTVQDDVMYIAIRGDRARAVPVLQQWKRTLARSIEGRSTGDLFHGVRLVEYAPRVLQTFISEHPCHPRANAARLSCGWLVAQINAGTPLPLLLSLAGLSSVTSLQRYISHAEPRTLANHLAVVVGSAAVR
jgi:integrase